MRIRGGPEYCHTPVTKNAIRFCYQAHAGQR